MNNEKNTIYMIVCFISFLLGISIGCGLLFSLSQIKEIVSVTASFATACTLIFLVCQHLSTTNRQNIQEQRQALIWQEQQRMLNFEKYQLHTSMFYNLLDDIEKNHKVIFINRVGLYNNIFNKNSFESTSTTVSLDEDRAHSLSDIIHHFNYIANLLPQVNDSPDKLHTLLTDILRLGYNLNIKFTTSSKFGDVVAKDFDQRFIINAFNIGESLFTYAKIIERIIGFSIVQNSQVTLNQYSPFACKDALLQFSFGPRWYGSANFEVILGDLRKILREMYSIYTYILNVLECDKESKEYQAAIHHGMELFYNQLNEERHILLNRISSTAYMFSSLFERIIKNTTDKTEIENLEKYKMQSLRIVIGIGKLDDMEK